MKYNFKRKSDLISISILNSIKNKEKWENNFLKQLFENCEIKRTNPYPYLVRKHDFKKYFSVFLIPANKIAYNDLFSVLERHNYNCWKNDNNEFKTNLKKITNEKSKIRINTLIPEKFNEFNLKLTNILGKPNKTVYHNFSKYDVWFFNGYKIEISQLRTTFYITLKNN
ncbi:hypothetical protein H3Z83_07470 [Tenacibaculum sp. S7007]|uniref:Uncharacterized protein n=1 Tax=Tenacibaculum pelagium TaxID=2759527 RepID=A0A839APP6_9FLAO|nr:hypothetical protein [Tenacibaculum pelagium]MBA6156350.1 hypothetical protein [Tenacibaculum pelagium]